MKNFQYYLKSVQTSVNESSSVENQVGEEEQSTVVQTLNKIKAVINSKKTDHLSSESVEKLAELFQGIPTEFEISKTDEWNDCKKILKRHTFWQSGDTYAPMSEENVNLIKKQVDKLLENRVEQTTTQS